MGITFVSLIACYVVLLDWEAIARMTRRAAPPTVAGGVAGDHLRRAAPAGLLGLLLIAVMTVQGARGAVQAWPLGCYPTLDRIVSNASSPICASRRCATTARPWWPGRPEHGRRRTRTAGLGARLAARWVLRRSRRPGAARPLRGARAARSARGGGGRRRDACTLLRRGTSVLPGAAGQPPASTHLLAELPLPITSE